MRFCLNIIDPELSDVAIANIDKTTFLQMLGRIRIDDKKINLYIKNYSLQYINYYRNLYEYIFSCMNEFEMIWSTKGFTEKHPFESYPIMSPKKMNVVLNKIYKLKDIFPAMMEINWTPNTDPHRDYFKKELIIEYKPNMTGVRKILYSLYEFNKLFAKIENYDGYNSYFYLKEQLSWINQHYDKTHWINYENSKSALYDFIERYIVKNDINKEEQLQFSRGCVERMVKLPDVSKNIKKINTQMKKDPSKYAGKKVLNDGFKIMEIPYEITSVQKMKNGKRATFWHIEKISLTENDTLQNTGK